MALVCDNESTPLPTEPTDTPQEPPTEEAYPSEEAPPSIVPFSEEAPPSLPTPTEEAPPSLATPPAASDSGELPSEATPEDPDKDLEDGEIEDDEEGEEEEPPVAPPPPIIQEAVDKLKEVGELPKEKKKKKEEERLRHERKPHEEKKRHMTEAEKSILHLRRRERLQREKWEKYRKDQGILEPPVDDFAINLEKAIASVMKKDRHTSDEEKDEEKRGRKRRGNRDKDRKGVKQRKLEGFSEGEGAICEEGMEIDEKREGSSEESFESDEESDRGEERRGRKRKGRNREARARRRSRERREMQQQQGVQQGQVKDSQGVCVFFLQGKCQKNDCPYSHEAMPPMKLELCKFYLKDCCAKGEKCSYMHSEFPCKFYHTGLVCLLGDNCKFAHGGPLDEHRRQILFKHIETAPREILGGFPRMSREEALNKINIAQQNLIVQYGGERQDDKPLNIFDISVPPPMEATGLGSDNRPKEKRNRPSRWQDPEPLEAIKHFNYSQDQDMRITSNGDIDMRTLPPMTQLATQQEEGTPMEPDANFTQDIDIRNPNMIQFDTKDIDIRNSALLGPKDVDIRQIPAAFDSTEPPPSDVLPMDMPKTQRDLYMRIQSQQKTNLPEDEKPDPLELDDNNINWYSDDDDDDENRLTIKVEGEEERNEGTILSPTQIKPQEVVEKLGDLSKIDISAEVTKLLTSMSQQKESVSKPVIRDPRQQRVQQPQQAVEQAKVSIYEQGSISGDLDGPKSPDEVVEGEMRSRPDVDLRNLGLPFKGMMNYTPAKEIDASINSHPPMIWRVEIVEIPRPDYTGLKLNIQDAEKTGDPRLRKIFRLSTEEKDSPASPKASPKSTPAPPRIDPRLKKLEETKLQQPPDTASLSYAQQLNILQSSPFFQSLTSNQKLLLNQELAARNDQNGLNDPVLGGMLSTLNLVPGNPANGAALGILANVNKLNPMMGPPGPPQAMMRGMQPGLLGAAPGIPNMGGEYGGFDPRGPPGGQFGGFPQQGDGGFGGGGFEEYYPQQENFHGRENRGFNNRDRRRGGRNNFNRNNGNRNFRNRNNRNNRGHTPP